MVGSIVISIVLTGLAIASFLFRYRKPHVGTAGNTKVMSVIEALPLSPRERLVLVKLDNRRVVLSVGEKGAHPVAFLDDQDWRKELFAHLPMEELH